MAKKKVLRKEPPTTISKHDPAVEYAVKVLHGDEVAGPHVRNACQRFIDDLWNGKKRGLYYDEHEREYILNFYPDVLNLSDGQFEGRPFDLHPSQSFILANIFAWKKKDGFRRFRRAYIEEGKGNGKSPLIGGVGLFCLTADREPGAQVYSAGQKLDTSSILFFDAAKMVRKSPKLFNILTISGTEGKEYNIAYLANGSFFRPTSKSVGKTGSGPRPHAVLADEIHEMTSRDIIDILEKGFKFRRQPLIVMITNSGTDKNSVCYEEHAHAIKCAAGSLHAENDPEYIGEIIDDSTFSYVCALDKDDDPFEDESCWKKANPLLDVTITTETLREAVKQARARPGTANSTKRLHFCMWTDSDTAWMSTKQIEPVLKKHKKKIFEGKRCALGVDLSSKRDLTSVAISAVVDERKNKETGMMEPIVAAAVHSFTPLATLKDRAMVDKVPYERWVEDGHLIGIEGEIIKLDHVAAFIKKLNAKYDLDGVAYDRYAYEALKEELDNENVLLSHIEHPQGGKRRGEKALGMKKGLWFPGSLSELENLILDKRIIIDDNPVTKLALLSAITECDPYENYWLSKRHAVNRIDPAVALVMSIGLTMGMHKIGARDPFSDPDFQIEVL